MFCEKCGHQIDETAKFCPNCGYNVGITKETVNEPSATQHLKKKKANICSILSIVFASIGMIPLLNFLFVPVAVILAIIGFATGKNKGAKAKIASVIVLLISIVISLLWMLPAIIGYAKLPFNNVIIDNQNTPTLCSHSYSLKKTEATCLSGGYATYKCSLCDETKREYKSALGHDWSNKKCKRCGICSHSYTLKSTEATCLSSGYAIYQCSLCYETKKEYESALGHDWLNNKCKRCSAIKDLELDPMDNNILTIEQIDWDINSADGVELSINCTNHTNKQIAYVYFTLKFYDRMGNPAYCSIRSEHTRRLRVTGPINAGEKDTYYWDPIIYNGSTAAIKPLKIEIEFTDGTKQTINCTGRYWYSNSYYGGDLKD